MNATAGAMEAYDSPRDSLNPDSCNPIASSNVAEVESQVFSWPTTQAVAEPHREPSSSNKYNTNFDLHWLIESLVEPGKKFFNYCNFK